MSALIELGPDDVLVFTRVVELGSFSGAARQLGVPTSTVSRRVARLEERLGVRLLHRTTRRLGLTDAGRILLERGERIEQELEDARRAVHELQSTPRGRLSLTAPVDLGVPLTPLLAEFLETYPEVDLRVVLTNRHLDLVEEGCDVALRAGKLKDSSLVATRLLSDTGVVLMASPDYLKRRGRPRRVEDLEKHHLVMFESFSRGSVWTLSTPRGQVRIRGRARLLVNHLDVVMQAVREGLGIGLLPRLSARRELGAGTLVRLFPKVSYPDEPLWAVYPSRRHLAPSVKAFVEFTRARIGRYLRA